MFDILVKKIYQIVLIFVYLLLHTISNSFIT